MGHGLGAGYADDKGFGFGECYSDGFCYGIGDNDVTGGGEDETPEVVTGYPDGRWPVMGRANYIKRVS